MNNRFNPLPTLSAAAFGAAIVCVAAPAQAFIAPPPVTFGYECISNNKAADCTTGESQLGTRVSAYSPTQVLFQFFNLGPNPSSITRVFFEDTLPKTLLEVANIFNSDGVNFVKDPQGQANLPGGNNISFTSDFRVGSTSPTQPSGVNPGEIVGILFNVRPEYSGSDSFNAVITDLQRGSLRVGLQVQGFSGGGSEQFVNEEVPEPMTILGTAVAIAGGAALKKRAANKANQEKVTIS